MPTPHLPTELWDKILHFTALPTAKDPQHSWIHFYSTARQTCRLWRSSIPRIYLELFLQPPRRCIIDFDCGCDYVKGMGKCAFGMEMLYSHLDPVEKGRVVFREGKATRGNEGESRYERAKYSNWSGKMEIFLGFDEGAKKEGGRFDLTPYVISIFGASLDCELPGLRFDVGRKEISFEWEGFLEGFVREYRELERRRRAVIPRVKAMVKGVDTSTVMNAIGSALLGIVSNRRVARRDVRRERIVRFYKARYGFVMREELIDKEHEKEQVERLEDAEGAGTGRDAADEEDKEDADRDKDEDENEEEEDDEDEEDAMHDSDNEFQTSQHA